MIPIANILWYFFLFISLYAGFSTILMSWNLTFGQFSQFGYSLAAISIFITFLTALRYNSIFAQSIQHLTFVTYKVGEIRWIAFCIVTGIIIRIIWFLLFPPQFRSDYATYFILARNLFEYSSYSGHNLGYAYWPPGYPLFLYIHFLFFGVHSWVPLIANLWLFALTIIVIFSLSKILSLGNFVSYYSLSFLVFWPTYITSVTLPSKEMIGILLLPLSILLTIMSTRICVEKYSLAINFSIGLLSGFMSLNQPSFIFFPIILIVYQWTSRINSTMFFRKFIMMLIGSILVISPWTIRNYRVLNEFVLISTNGGDVFYRANNPIATGRYLPAGERSLEKFDEVDRSKVGYRWGME